MDTPEFSQKLGRFLSLGEELRQRRITYLKPLEDEYRELLAELTNTEIPEIPDPDGRPPTV